VASLVGKAGSKPQPSLASQLSTRINQSKGKTRKEVNLGLREQKGMRRKLCNA